MSTSGSSTPTAISPPVTSSNIITKLRLASPPPRSESLAYPPANTRSRLSRMQYYLRQHTRAVGVAVAVLTFCVVLTSDYIYDHPMVNRSKLRHSKHHDASLADADAHSFAGAMNAGYFYVQDSIMVQDDRTTGYHFGMLTDLDELSRIPNSKKPKFQSHMALGTLRMVPGSNASGGLKGSAQTSTRYEITFDEAPVRNLITGHNEAGRGGEFSELTVFDGRLLTADDRTGDIFEILNMDDGNDSFCVPRLVVTEGPGDTDKGMKWEWAAVKDNELYLGSMGKEFTNSAGEIENVNNLWIAIVDTQGRVRRENWNHVYEVVRRALGAEAPGYIIMEAVNWSEHLQKWVFLPRRISHEKYYDVEDEKRGGRKLVLVDETFTTTKVVDLQLESVDPLKGFASFAFVPNTGDRHVLAIRSVEEDCALGDIDLCKQRSYLVVFDILTGESLSPEVQYEQNWKFEGVEFFNPYVRPPEHVPHEF